MEIYQHLRANCDRLLEAYHSNLEDVQRLQDTLIRDILPSVTDELNLSPHATEWAKEWLLDTASIFRIARKNHFTRSFTLEAIRKNLVWRLDNLWPPPDSVSMSNVHCLPPTALDPFGRPIIIIETVPLVVEIDVMKRGILQFFETVRLNLYELANNVNSEEGRPLQCMVVIDLKNLSFQPAGLDIMTWAIREVIPRFPGMLAGVFLVNYSWAHSGVWNVIKRVLPDQALSRVFFPPQEEVIRYFTPACLPREYGGDLPSIAKLAVPDENILPTSIPGKSSRKEPPVPSTSWISPTSMLNPFFGYPAMSSSDRRVPALHHGRRRKRDLLRTLAFLWWTRWDSYVVLGLCISIALILVKARRRLFLLHSVFWCKFSMRA